MQCLEIIDDEGKHYSPYTRDSFGIAVKATYAEDETGQPIIIFKKNENRQCSLQKVAALMLSGIQGRG